MTKSDKSYFYNRLKQLNYLTKSYEIAEQEKLTDITANFDEEARFTIEYEIGVLSRAMYALKYDEIVLDAKTDGYAKADTMYDKLKRPAVQFNSI